MNRCRRDGMLRELEAALVTCMQAEQRPLHRRLEKLRHRGRGGRDAAGYQTALEALAADIRRSAERRQQRAAALPVPEFPSDLPISARRREIAEAIAAHPVVIVCGETGSGKSTQLPKICLSLGRGVAGLIGHTQPRRIAARTIAARIASELKTAVGGGVGYKVRFSEQVSDATYLKLMTDGILLAETQGDHRLLAYDTLIIDEAHERSLNIDFLLGYLKTLLPRRPDLKVIVTSATIDPRRFSEHFGGAPIIEVSGRTYPVEVRYRPLVADEETEEVDIGQGIVDAVHELSRIDRGDILIFLPGEREIRDTAELLQGLRLAGTEVLALYARQSNQEQQRIFQPHGRRHIVLATNVAETSLTVPGVRYVIDTGLARISRYSPRTKVQRLPIEPIAQSSADQRAGRCGRTSGGVCIRLYGEEDYAGRPDFTEPEVRRTSLAAVILQLEALEFGEVEDFPFIDPPESRYLSDGYKLLHELGAVDEARHLTALGRRLARLPVDPRIGRLILAAHAGHCLGEVLIIAAALGIQDPRERPLERRQQADAAHARFSNERSDFLWYLNFWRAYEEQSRQSSKRRLAGFCHEHFVSAARMREWRDTWAQLRDLTAELGLSMNREPADYAAIHRALLTGFVSQVAFRVDAGDYLGTRNIKPVIFPGSTLFKRGPKWFMAAQLVETSRLYARVVAAIEPEWIEQVAPHLLKRSYSEPHWERRAGRVMAFEKTTLLRLTVSTGRKVDFGAVDPAEARDIFIREALVEGEFDTKARFFRRNRELMEELRTFEHKARRLDILADGQAIFEFYDQRVPENIRDGRTFEAWLAAAERENPQALFIPREYLLRAEPAAAALFPDHASCGPLRLPLSYRFEPGHGEDGVTVTVPLLALNQLEPAAFEWLVPGLIREKIGLLVRSLPKALRRHFVPIPQFVEQCVAGLEFGSGNLLERLVERMRAATGVAVKVEDFRTETLPDHLCMNFRIVDERQRTVAMGRDLAALQRRFGDSVCKSFSTAPGWSQEREKIVRWDFGDLPEAVTVTRAGVALTGYPALEDRGDSVALRIVDTPARAQALADAGLRRLFMLELAQPVKYLRANLPGFAKMSLWFSGTGDAGTLRRDLIEAVFDRVFLGDETPIRRQQDFVRRREQGRGELVATVNALCALAAECLERAHALRQVLAGADKPVWGDTVTEVREQLAMLIYPGFISATPAEALKHFPRYLKAALARLEKMKRDPARDRQRAVQFRSLWQAYTERCDRLAHSGGGPDPALESFRWLLEEFRVSLFAQELGTAVPVSAARLEKEWKKITG